MKRFLYIFAAISFLFIAGSTAQSLKADANQVVKFQKYDSYFEKNNSNLKGQKSYLAITNQKRFDGIFGEAAVMGENTFLPTDAFKNKIVIASIKRGNLRSYDNVSVAVRNGVLTVSCNVKDAAPNSPTYSSPLIISIDKGRYKEIVFMENGKRAGTIKVKSW